LGKGKGKGKGKERATAKAKTEADPYGMTNKRTGNSNTKNNSRSKAECDWVG
jgi:hypothetical protein